MLELQDAQVEESRRLRNYKAEAKATSIELELQLTQIHNNFM